MPVTPELLEAVRCPVSGQTLRLATESDQLDPDSFPEGGLISADNSLAYPIRDSFPILLKDEAVKLSSTAR